MLGSVTEAEDDMRFDEVGQNAPRFVAFARPAIVNGAAGLLFGTREDPIAVLSFTVSGGSIAELDLVSDPAKLRHLAAISGTRLRARRPTRRRSSPASR